MKSFVLFLAFAAAVAAIKIDVTKHTTNMGKFQAFVEQYNKKYNDDMEYHRRFKVFSENLILIDRMNSMNSSAKFGINKFADISPAEFKDQYLSKTPMTVSDDWPVAKPYPEEVVKAAPDSWDWRDHGAVTPVKDQGACGSCWAFSTTGNVEGQWFLAGHPLVGISEQNLVDCDHVCSNGSCDSGCDGGLMGNAFQYIIQNHGIDTEETYQYQGVDGSCSFSSKNVGATLKSWQMLPGDETQMATFLASNGPISIAVDAQLWQFYIEGIFDFPWCGTSLDHGVLIVGYGTGENVFFEQTPFWTIKNSWGNWGESGYIRLERGEGLCGVNLYPCSGSVN